MNEKNEIEKVWFIENNELKKENRVVTKVNYDGVEIPVLKTQINEYCQDYLFKDKNNEYWSMLMLSINIKNFQKVNDENSLVDSKEYCDKFMRFIKSFNLKEYFSSRIEDKQYFNLCQLKYISEHYPEMYEQAKISRETVLENNRKEREEERLKREQEKKEKVKTVNEEFEKKLDEIKVNITNGKNVKSEELQYYKDNKYENGITTQNCFLYLAKQYGINIPLATQGFINNRLVSYDFQTGDFSYYKNKSKTISTKIRIYLDEIYKETKKEFEQDTEIKKEEKKLKEDR